MSMGFIRESLELKCLILYVAARVSEPLSLTELQGLTMIDDGIDYFSFAQCLSELVQTEHLSVDADERYIITAKGVKNSLITADSLPVSVRNKARMVVENYNRELLRRAQVAARVERRDNDTCTVVLHLSDDVDDLMDLRLMAASEEQAKALADQFRANPEDVYQKVIQALFGN
ncbi:MAG: DUF4364 family protein [Oscillospiraceae bacterium]|nr:DUF4364 family protein [Oscillospiraceae bacterium]